VPAGRAIFRPDELLLALTGARVEFVVIAGEAIPVRFRDTQIRVWA
jgi:hypothetical protein